MAEFASPGFSSATTADQLPTASAAPEDATTTLDIDPSVSAGVSANDGKNWGNFHLLQRLGAGGFGEVYRAWDPVLEREIAVKLLLPSGLDADQEFASIVAEARAIARVRHPNIVSVYGVDRRNGRVGFWSDYVRGRTLTNLVETGGPLSVEQVARIGATLCDALSAVHAAGLLHRDVKASNAMRDENGRVLLMDFGLSQELHRAARPAGTPKYMAPELLARGNATVQSDIYAMGVLLMFLVTGKYPLSEKSESSGTAPAASQGPAPKVPPVLDIVLRKATDPDPQLRYASATRFAEVLTALLPETKPVLPRKRSNKVLWTAAAVLALCLGIALTPQFRTAIQSKVAGTTPEAYKDYLAADDALARYDKPGNTALAISLYRKTLERSPDFALAEAGLARASWRMYLDTSDAKWVTQANQASDKAISMNPNLAAVQMTAGSLHVAQGKFDLGLQELLKAQELDERSADVHAALGEAYRQQGRLDQAKTELQSAIDLAPDNWRWPYLLGALCLDTGDFKSAEDNFNLALTKTPDNAAVFYNIGVLRWQEKRLPEARAAFEQAIRLSPTINPVMALGSVLLLQGDYAEAASDYRRAVELSPSSWIAWGSLGAAYEWSSGNLKDVTDAYTRAIAIAEEARKNTPDDPALISQLGNFYANLHKEAEALPLLRKALLLAPKDPDVVARVGTSYEALGRRQDAIKLIDQALKLGFSADYARKTPALRNLRHDPNAPAQIRE